ncbi:unnamed protein product [Caenorhabditis brenneri]
MISQASVIFAIISIGLVLGAPGASMPVNCRNQKPTSPQECMAKLINFGRDTATGGFWGPAEVQKFQTSCKALQDCYTSLECQQTAQPLAFDVADSIRSMCDSVLNLSERMQENQRESDRNAELFTAMRG